MSGDVKGVYILRTFYGVPNKACIDEGYARGNMGNGDTIEYHALLTPAQAAVLESAKAIAQYDDSVDVPFALWDKFHGLTNTLRAQEAT